MRRAVPELEANTFAPRALNADQSRLEEATMGLANGWAVSRRAPKRTKARGRLD
jgi:hypothetical protein